MEHIELSSYDISEQYSCKNIKSKSQTGAQKIYYHSRNHTLYLLLPFLFEHIQKKTLREDAFRIRSVLSNEGVRLPVCMELKSIYILVFIIIFHSYYISFFLRHPFLISWFPFYSFWFHLFPMYSVFITISIGQLNVFFY